MVRGEEFERPLQIRSSALARRTLRRRQSLEARAEVAYQHQPGERCNEDDSNAAHDQYAGIRFFLPRSTGGILVTCAHVDLLRLIGAAVGWRAILAWLALSITADPPQAAAPRSNGVSPGGC